MNRFDLTDSPLIDAIYTSDALSFSPQASGHLSSSCWYEITECARIISLSSASENHPLYSGIRSLKAEVLYFCMSSSSKHSPVQYQTSLKVIFISALVSNSDEGPTVSRISHLLACRLILGDNTVRVQRLKNQYHYGVKLSPSLR